MATIKRSAIYKWADSKEQILLTIEIPGIQRKNVKVHLTPDGLFDFTATKGDIVYQVNLSLRERIRAADSEWGVNDRNVVVKIRKLEPERWKSLQIPSIKKPPFEKVDWDHMELDSSDEEDDYKKTQMEPFILDNPSDFSYESLQKFAPTNKLRIQIYFEDYFLDVLILIAVWLQIWIAPYTKVEESFNTQAMHDILFHRTDLASYDHHEFPGVVPRTFLGALIVAFLSSPFVFITRTFLQMTKLPSLYIVRGVLGLLLTLCFSLFRKEVGRKFGKDTAVWLGLLTLSQFHLTFYMSRPLPNIFALGPTLIAFTFWLREKYREVTWILAITTIIVRSDLCILVLPILLEALIFKRVGFFKLISWGITAAIVGLLTSVLIDSIFWGRFVWPEGELLAFNVLHNKSSDYGVSPFHWYFTSALPRSLMVSIPLLFVALYFDFQRLKPYLLPVVAFICLYSFLPHKELRFIFSAIPIFNMFAAVGIGRLWRNRQKYNFLKWLVLFSVLVVIILGFISAWGMVWVSSYNYPGGSALTALHKIKGEDIVFHNAHHESPGVHYVHICNLAAISGVSRFLELDTPKWRYSKQEGVISDYSQFTHLLSENSTVGDGRFYEVARVEGFSGLTFEKFPPFKTAPLISIMEKTHRKF
eukprot:TRINITY_DN5834_c0_g2_i1.p1 TRINITY_DN5834_c0_g2~~TRINITY_DN5834_c0_g2_i1.p1  ORF type:complete len:645 (-),score=80.72 TRINITY_DN5834_c0_g2_i1:354-2288(-)